MVLPQKGIHYKVYIAECLKSLADETNIEVFYLDLSHLHPNFWNKQWENLIRNIVYKRLLEKSISGFCRKSKIQKLKLPQKTLSEKVQVEFGERELQEFLRESLESTHSFMTGGDSNLEKWIPRDLLELEVFLFKLAYQAVKFLNIEYNFDRVITVNGRHLIDSAVRLAATTEKLAVNLLETGSGRTHGWHLFSTSPHNYEEDVVRIEREWVESGQSERQALLGLNDRLLGDRGDGLPWNPKLNAEETKRFLISLDKEEFIVFFPSTLYELVPGRNFKIADSFNGSQTTAFRALANVARRQQKKLIVRGHPSGGRVNLEAVEDKIWSEECKKTGAVYIPSGSGIDSLSLMYKSSVNVVYQSWVGAESIALGQPTLVLANNNILTHFLPTAGAFSDKELWNKLQNPPKLDPRDTFPLFRAWGFGGQSFSAFKSSSSGQFYTLSGKAVEELRAPFKLLRNLTGISLYKQKVGAQNIVWTNA